MSNAIEKVHYVNGGAIVEFDDGYIAELCAFERGEESCDRWCDEHHVIANAAYLVNGWEGVNEWLRGCGYPELELW